MNILSITSILPVPEVMKENDVVFTFYENYKRNYNDNINFLRPSPTRLLSGKNSNWRKRNETARLKCYNYGTFNVKIIAFMAIGRLENLLAIFSNTIVIFNFKKIKRIVQEGEYQLCHAQFIFPDGLLSLYLKKKYSIPYIITVRSEQRLFNGLFSRYFVRKILKNAEKITTPSGIMREFLSNKGYDSILIPHGLEEDFFNSTYNKHCNKSIKILSICSLIGLKNIDYVISALAKIKNEENFEYHIYGDGPEKSVLESHIKNLSLENKIKIMGQLGHKELITIMKGYDIFVLPSEKETFGRVYFEAMACGLATIMAPNTGAAGYVENEIDVIILENLNVETIQFQINRLLTDRELLIKLGQNAEKKMKNYTWDRICLDFHKIYHSIVN